TRGVDDGLAVEGTDRITAATAADGGRPVQRVPGLGAYDPVDADPGGGLQAAHGRPGGRAEGPVDRDGCAALVELGLQGADGLAAIALTQLGLRAGRRGRGPAATAADGG